MIQVMEPEHPADLVGATHVQIRRHAQLIERLAAHPDRRGAEPQARDVAAIALRFFDGAGGEHHRHEEVDLFIAVEHRVPSAELNATRALLHRLRRDHQEIAALWAQIRPGLEAIARGDAASVAIETARRFSAAQARHIEREEAELMPLVRRVLDAPLVARVGEAMLRRRGRQTLA